MLKVKAQKDTLVFGERDPFTLDFERTLRIPDDGKTYPLPPGLGKFPIRKVEDYKDRAPAEWVKHGGVFIPMYQREALWIRFVGFHWKPRAVKVAVGKVNAVSGKPWSEELRPGETDYMVSPPQFWIDGINAGDDYIRQFVAMPLGMGYTVEAQVTGKEEFGGLQIVVYEPKPDRFPDEPPKERWGGSLFSMKLSAAGVEMGLGAGGKMKQKIYPDPHGIDTWDPDNYGRVFVHIVNSMMYRELTGEEPPPTPISAKTYAHHGLPWFDLYDEKLGDIAPPDALKGVKSVKEKDAEKGFTPQQDDSSVEVPEDKVIKYKVEETDPNEVRDGDW